MFQLGAGGARYSGAACFMRAVMRVTGQEETVSSLGNKSIAGVGFMLRRQLAGKAIFIAGNIVLARLLSPQDFGAYAVIAFTLQFFATFADVGLGAALIQKKEDATNEEVATTFWIQQMLVLTVILLIFILSPILPVIYTSLSHETVWVVRTMAIAFIFTSLKTIPLIFMERSLEFRKIAAVELLEQVVFFSSAILFAWSGLQIWSFVYATILKEMTGCAAVYALSVWRPILSFRLESVRGLMRFGLPFQGNNLLNFVKEGVTPLLVGGISGAAGVGYVTWARSFAFTPLFVSESFGRVAFPAFSLIRDDRALLTSSVERSIRMMTLVLFPVTFIMAVFASDITRIFFSEKWMPGLGAFYLYCTSPIMIGMMLPMYSAILSLGRSGLLLRQTFILVVLEWGLGIPFVMMFGYTGIAINQPIITAIFFFIYRRVLFKEGVVPKIVHNVWRQLITALIAAAAIRLMALLVTVTVVTLPIFVAAGFVIFIGLMYVTGKKLVSEFKDNLAVIISGV
jgi:O-antigen/teichoic acid export membrane protein